MKLANPIERFMPNLDAELDLDQEVRQFEMKTRAIIGLKFAARVARSLAKSKRFDVSTQQTIAAPVK